MEGGGTDPRFKGLSHETDLKKFVKKFTELGLTKGHGWILNFLGLQ